MKNCQAAIILSLKAALCRHNDKQLLSSFSLSGDHVYKTQRDLGFSTGGTLLSSYSANKHIFFFGRAESPLFKMLIQVFNLFNSLPFLWCTQILKWNTTKINWWCWWLTSWRVNWLLAARRGQDDSANKCDVPARPTNPAHLGTQQTTSKFEDRRLLVMHK